MVIIEYYTSLVGLPANIDKDHAGSLNLVKTNQKPSLNWRLLVFFKIAKIFDFEIT